VRSHFFSSFYKQDQPEDRQPPAPTTVTIPSSKSLADTTIAEASAGAGLLASLPIMASPTVASLLILCRLLVMPSILAFSTITTASSRCDVPTPIAMMTRGELDDKDPLLTTIPIDQCRNVELPSIFAYPHFYEPHPIAKYACDQVRAQIETLATYEWSQHHFFGQSDVEGNAVGKMFGVLVVHTDKGLGYLKAYSGTITGVTHSEQYGFCPSLFNRFETCRRSGFSYLSEEEELNKMNQRIAELDRDPKRKELQMALNAVKETVTNALTFAKTQQKEQKKKRQLLREQMREELSPEDFAIFEAELAQESAYYQRQLKQVKAANEEELENAQASLDEFELELQELKLRRREKSNSLQNQLFQQYQFLNINGQRKSLLPIFADTPLQRPPSGAGDCAAPKLLQQAFISGYKPIALAEFWWGDSPLLEMRKHNFYYPACRGKCEPILRHMLQGMNVEDNPLDHIGEEVERNKLDIVFEDEFIMVVNKPNEMLSTPGRHQEHSVYTIIKEGYPAATGPLLVHRLDMSTSGILLIAKDKYSHQILQEQFINRTVKKRYTALLEGLFDNRETKGVIDLPLALDYFNRPMQKVDFSEGKAAQTLYEVVETDSENKRTRIHFYPQTGRTHQLRVHAAHEQGLNLPIVGDDIYGQRDERLHLHADFIEFVHPATKETMKFSVKAPF